MRNLLLLPLCIFLLSACADMDDMFGEQHGGNGYHDGNRYHGGNSYYGGDAGYGGYYPYGNANYPRDRIYVIERQQPCKGYAYQGYCYRNKNDYQNSVAWDRDHGRDDNWHKQRKDWCNDHDCRKEHDSRDRGDNYDRNNRHERDRDSNQHGWGGSGQEQSKQYRPARKRVDQQQPQTKPDAGHQEQIRRHERPATSERPESGDSQRVKHHSGQRVNRGYASGESMPDRDAVASPEQRPVHERKSRRGNARNQQPAPQTGNSSSQQPEVNRASEGAPAE